MASSCLPLAGRHLLLTAGALALAAAAGPAAAQGVPRPARPDPLDAATAVPPATYESTLKRLRRPTDTQPVPWREANDTVLRIGGWRAYAREAQAVPAAPAAPPAPPAAVPSPAHAGHGARPAP